VQITVHAPVSLAALWLAPKLPGFTQGHPTIDIRLSSVIWDNAVPDEATDLEIRYGTGQWHGYRSERLMNQSILAVCSPQLMDAARRSGEIATLIPRHLIHIMGYENHWLKVRQGLRLGNVDVNRGPAVDTTIAALELAASGTGCALSHRIFLAAYFSAGRLVAASEQEFPDDYSYFVVAPERPQRVRREVQEFREWLVSVASADA
jgi:LysR family glycine cleavage system transcriptional activator